MSKWESIYRRFVALERRWSVHEHSGVNRQLFHSAVLSSRSDADVEREFASFGVGDLHDALWSEARELRRLLDFSSRGRFPADPCEDVYQAALTMMPFGEWTATTTHEKLYRGQRDARWRIVPSFFRNSRENRAVALTRLNALARIIVTRRPGLQTEQALALIQHYSKELSTQTWLLDITWDPAVALFFASDGGRTGETGVVMMLARREWEDLAASGRNRLGRIRLIEVPNVLRIERQRALFLDTSHPDLLEQYVAHSVWFRQVDDLVFEDQEADWPVSTARCYPEFDPTLEFLRGLGPFDDAAALQPALAPPSDASRPLDAQEYLAIAQSWCEEDGVALEPPYADVLAGVSLVHGRLQEHRDRLAIGLRSLHRLRDATRAIVHAQEQRDAVDVPRAMRFTFQRSMTDAERELLESIVGEASKPAGLGGSVADLPEFVASLLDELTPRLAELVVIGAADASEERVGRDIEAALGDRRFCVFDLRGATDIRGEGALATDVGKMVRLLMIDGTTATEWLQRLTRAFLDGNHRITLAEGWVERPRDRSIVVVHYGAKGIGDLAPILREPIVQFIA
ncbi:MAG: FRG domain-containing protein [Sedimenticolaceae bacterium]